MNINVTLFGQLITFGIFTWFTMRYIWPLLEQALDERQANIVNGLNAAKKNQVLLSETENKIKQELQAAELKVIKILQEANLEKDLIVEEGRKQAIVERNVILHAGEQKLEQEKQRVQEDLRKEIVGLALAGAEKLIQRSINSRDQAVLLDQVGK